ncbi:MAG TPA: HNH endonuclease [Longimicrobium sp.]|jgi:hypothetical protein
MPARAHSESATASENRQLDAEFSVAHEDGRLAIYLESGDGRGRNPDYKARLYRILERLASVSARIDEITVESKRTAGFLPDDKRLGMPEFPFPIPLGSATNLVKLRFAIGGAQEPVGQVEGKKGNRTKRIRIAAVPTPAYAHRMVEEWEMFLDGYGWLEDPEPDMEATNVTQAASPFPRVRVSALEGEKKRRMIWDLHRERALRDVKVRAFKDEHHGRLFCEVPGCGFDFELMYGSIGKDYAQVHHLKPLAKREQASLTELADLAVVCANCHVMIHLGGGCRPLHSLIPPREIRAAG